jgi:RNA polymerase sigma-70 factor (ECF subfamily)
MYQTARRAIADHYRAPVRRRELAVGATAELVEAGGPMATVEEDEVSAAQELATCLGPMIAQLPEVDQEALRLVEFDAVPQVDAAATLGISVSGMKSRVQRARGRLRKAVEDCCRVALDRRGGVISYRSRRLGDCDSCD